MKDKKIKIAIILVAISLAALIGVQLYWANNALRLQKNELDRHLNQELASISRELESTLVCFEVFARMKLPPKYGFYLLKNQIGPNSNFLPILAGNTDSVKLHFYNPYNKELYNFNNIKFNRPVDADITMRFEYALDTEGHRYTGKTEPIEELTGKNFREKLSSKRPMKEVLDTLFADSLIQAALIRNGIRSKYHYGVLSENNKIEYASQGSNPSLLIKTNLQADFLSTKYFNKPYRLVVYYTTDTMLLMHTIWGILLSSLVIICMLAISFWYFISTMQKQKRLSNMKSDFIDNMTHEFKTPLTNISLAIQTIHENGTMKEPARLERYMEIISEENERLRTNVERVLHVASMEKPDFKLDPEPLDINILVERVASSFQMQREEAIINICLEATKPLVLADEVHMTNVLYNLLDNAVKYSPGKAVIKISTSNSSTGTIILIEDKGQGMNSETQKRIFDKFYRAQTGNIHNVKGFGLGLSYVKTIINAHGGYITVRSLPGKGSRFEIILMNY